MSISKNMKLGLIIGAIVVILAILPFIVGQVAGVSLGKPSYIFLYQSCHYIFFRTFVE